ncbi:hypothetical protein MCC10023_0732 [Bifidobacterium longum subsp. longum]|nr:hypothetical protein MCC10023_0732 [Bifidobacterium longum subsp. longum]TCF20553.1 hypothetical protein MCC10089_0633 [Bifidobacterium longum subsp. longum]
MKSDYPRSGSWPARIRFAGMRIPCSAIADSVAPSARICERSMRRLKPPPHSKGSGAREHRSQRAADRRGYSLISGGLRGHASWKDPSGQSSCMPQGLCRAGSVEGTIHRGMGSGIQRLSQGHPSAPMIPHAAGMDGIQRTPPFCGSWLPWLACTEGERRRSGFPFRSPDIGGLSGGWHAGRRDRRPWHRMCSCGPFPSPGRGCRRLVR